MISTVVMAAVSSCTAMYCGSGYYAEQGAFHAPRPATRARSTGNAAVDTGLSYRASTFSAFSGKRTRKRRKRPPGAPQRGSHILTNTGLYGAAGGRYIPDFAFSATAEDLAARWTREFQAGIPPAGIRPALIKLGVAPGPLSKMNSKLVSAAALTHLRTGLVIASHTGDGLAFMAQLNLLKSHGVSSAAFIWADAQDEKDRSFYRKAAEAGAWIEFDGISSDTVDQNISLIQEVRRAGYLQHVLISQDAVGFYVGQEHGGYCPGYTFMFSDFLPQLRKRGMAENEIRTLTVENPRRALSQSN